MTSIVGKTNGANSSEYKLARLTVVCVTGLTAVAVTGGWMLPEQATAIIEAVETIVSNAVFIVLGYGTLRTVLKAVIAKAPASEVKE